MGKFLKDELIARGALREGKRHFPFAVTRAPVGLVRWCFWVQVAAPMLPGRWGGAEGSALPAEGALLSSTALSWGTAPGCLPKGRAAGQHQELWRLWAVLVSGVLGWLTTAGVQRVLLRLGRVLDFSHRKHPEPLLEDWLNRLSWGPGWGARRLGEHFEEASLLSVSSLNWADRKMLGYISLSPCPPGILLCIPL